MSIIAVGGIIVAEWCILKPLPPPIPLRTKYKPALCEEHNGTYPSSMAYTYFIILATIVSSIVAYHKIKNKHSTHNNVCCYNLLQLFYKLLLYVAMK